MIRPRPPVIERAERQRLEIVRNAWGVPVPDEDRRAVRLAWIGLAIAVAALIAAVWL